MDVWFLYVVYALGPLMSFSMNFMILSGILVLISVCMFIVSKYLLIPIDQRLFVQGGLTP